MIEVKYCVAFKSNPFLAPLAYFLSATDLRRAAL
jgi:hypothetical protein